MTVKTETAVRTVFILFIVGFFSLIVYVSLLGDNHKIDFAVEQYFQSMKDCEYDRFCDTADPEKISAARDCSDFNFLLETALLMKYGLVDAKDYKVLIKKSHFRIPWITEDTVAISIALAKRKSNLCEAFYGGDGTVYTKDMIRVAKAGKIWQIREISVEDPALDTLLEKVSRQINLEKYITRTENGFNLNRAEVRPENFSPMERRLFKYSMKRLSDL